MSSPISWDALSIASSLCMSQWCHNSFLHRWYELPLPSLICSYSDSYQIEEENLPTWWRLSLPFTTHSDGFGSHLTPENATQFPFCLLTDAGYHFLPPSRGTDTSFADIYLQPPWFTAVCRKPQASVSRNLCNQNTQTCGHVLCLTWRPKLHTFVSSKQRAWAANPSCAFLGLCLSLWLYSWSTIQSSLELIQDDWSLS